MTNQNAIFYKLQCLKNKVRFEVEFLKVINIISSGYDHIYLHIPKLMKKVSQLNLKSELLHIVSSLHLVSCLWKLQIYSIISSECYQSYTRPWPKFFKTISQEWSDVLTWFFACCRHPELFLCSSPFIWSDISGCSKSNSEYWISNMSTLNWVMMLIICTWLDIYSKNWLIQSFQMV